MATISISAEAYLAIVATMPEGSYTALRDDRGGYAIILDRMVLDHLNATRAPGESYSEVILRLATAQ
jgi:predicted CopG family antitoxin